MTRKRKTTNQTRSQASARSQDASGKPAVFSRRYALLGLAGVAGAGAVWFLTAAPTAAKEVVVYKNPSCGCCSKWADHLRASGFAVDVKAVNDMAEVKERYGTPWQLESCHTALVDGYVVEGHVPVREIERLLAERPDAKGLAVAGMPAGSPGMEGRYTDRYDVMLFRADGTTEVYARY